MPCPELLKCWNIGPLEHFGPCHPLHCLCQYLYPLCPVLHPMLVSHSVHCPDLISTIVCGLTGTLTGTLLSTPQLRHYLPLCSLWPPPAPFKSPDRPIFHTFYFSIFEWEQPQDCPIVDTYRTSSIKAVPLPSGTEHWKWNENLKRNIENGTEMERAQILKNTGNDRQSWGRECFVGIGLWRIGLVSHLILIRTPPSKSHNSMQAGQCNAQQLHQCIGASMH